jgi:nitrogen fixation NifU-like protein
MSDLRELYQQVILDHNRNPRNYKALEEADRKADGHNPLCGDRVTVYLKLEGDRIVDVTFQGQGCAISTASASMMTQSLKGKTLEEARALFREFHEMVTGACTSTVGESHLGKLAVFQGVCEFPTRVKCATIAWHTMQAALEGRAEEPVTTE